MSDLVDPDTIERIVGAKRHETDHYGRAQLQERKFYILHSKECVRKYRDLRNCLFSLALDHGAPRPIVDAPVVLGLKRGRLVVSSTSLEPIGGQDE